MLKPQRNFVRDLVGLDGFWSFRCDPEKIGESAGWTKGFAAECELAVPGSWNEQRSDLAHYFGVGWYQTQFDAPDRWKNHGLWLHVGSAQQKARAWLNGELVASHRGGCLPFECPLHQAIKIGGPNVLVIEVDGSIDPWAIPPASLKDGEEREGFHNSYPRVAYDFFPYGGLPRSVQLQITPTVDRIRTIRVETELSADLSRADLRFSAESSFGAGTFWFEVEGLRISATVDAQGWAEAILVVESPRLWGIGRGELYKVRVSVESEFRVLDSYEQSFGIRKVEITPHQFLLNGRPVFFKGFGKHEDFPVVGRGLVPPLIVRDFDLLNWVGANSFRTSHYPYAEEWYEYADRQGVLVIAEAPLVGLNTRMYCPEVLAHARDVIGRMIARDRHHPSVVMWSLANEPNIDTPEAENFFETLANDARAADQSRPITYVAHREPEHNRPLVFFDVVCLNKYFGWYEQPGQIGESLAAFGQCLDRFRAAFGKPVILAEFGADAIAGLHLHPPEMFSEEFQAEIIAAQYTEARLRSWIIGTHVWAFSDFKTAQSITRVATNRKGVFTRDRQPKMAAHRLRQLWSAG